MNRTGSDSVSDPDLPLVSIVTPSYNQGQFIRATIESVLGQQYPNIEYIVIDGGSTDDTVSIIKEYQQKLSWVSESDNGQSDAINKGIRKATGDIIAYLNSDDIYQPGTIERVVEAFRSSPEADIVYGDYISIDVNGDILDRMKTIPFDPGILLYDANYISQPSSFYRTSLFGKIGKFDDQLQCLMDYEFFLRASSKGIVFKYIPTALAAIRFHSDCKTVGGAADLGIAKVRKVINSKYVPADLNHPLTLKTLSLAYRLKRYLKLIMRGRLDFMNLVLAYRLKQIAK